VYSHRFTGKNNDEESIGIGINHLQVDSALGTTSNVTFVAFEQFGGHSSYHCILGTRDDESQHDLNVA
jgi:hypothetical protein